ncbi:PREDICTED: aspartyl protease family protein At5g10770-like [Ipomoea nil]|uniref:aspartyl protease family protein At5g10770-like n=1 Tax=Ipomoea nil TaxID=35883 RepID=UPI000901D4AC|nr:PREDICTED: aspartyl protease family protein At5g10770-like [Ipomoea nil]
MATTAKNLFTFLLSFASFLFFLILSCSAEKGIASESLTESTHFHTVPLTSLFPTTHCHQPHTTHASKGLRRGASLKVVHKHGGCSTGKDNTPTLTDILNQDESRVNSIHARVNSARIDNLNAVSGVGRKKKIPDSKAAVPAKSGTTLSTGNYIVTVGLGNPTKSLTLVFDTGSDLTWTQCEPCVKTCYTQQETIFNPKLSTTYSNISCSAAACSGLTSATGNNPGCSSSTCVYGIQYGDSSFSVGFFAKDRLSLTATDAVEDFLFGCGQNNQGLFGKTAGLLGLGRDALSLVSQTAAKYGKYFSYCLPTKRGANGHLTFGKGGAAPVKYTPFATDQGASFYFIDVQAIAVGGKQLSISPVVFKSSGTIIDSGTVITRLPPAAYSALRSAFRQGMSKYPQAPALSILDTCYDLSKYTTVSVPKISFVLNGGVTMDLPLVGILLGNGASQVCLAFAGNGDASDVGIFGNIQQQTFEVVYDVAGGKLGIGAGGCS